MRKFILMSLLLGLFPALLLAHAPRNVEMVPVKGTTKWKITAQHSVADSTSHFIELITVVVDGKEVKKQTLKVQSSKASEVLEIVVPEIKKGSNVEVTAKCNKIGSKTYKFTAE